MYLASVVALNVFAHTIYVHPNGNDGNTGTGDAPLRTLAKAQQEARKVAGKAPITVMVGDGTYYLPQTLIFHSEDSGNAENPVVYRAVNEGKAILSGGLKLALEWTPWKEGIVKAQVPQGLEIDQLFVNGVRQRMARYPNFDASKPTAAYQGYAADAFSRERAAKWVDPTGGFIHAMHSARWGGYHYRITGKKSDGTVAYEGGWQNNRQMGMHGSQRMVENIVEELDAPGEWFHDAKTATLYFYPPVGLDIQSVEIVRLRHLIEFQGSQSAPVKHLALQGFVFRHAARTFMDTREPLLRSDWTIYRGGAVLLEGTEDISIQDCEFDQVGGNAVFFSHYNRRGLIRGCYIHDVGASGVCFVGDPKAVRDPLFEYGQTQDLSKIDRTPGPKTDNYPADCAVEDCLIAGVGRVERQPAGVQISMARRIAVRDTSIYDCARAGINVSEGTWGGHLVDGCDVFDTVLETHDHGSFNSWGRDRFWASKHYSISQPAVQADPTLPFLDAVEPTVLRNSRWRCDHGWDIDLDDGSSNYEIYNNLMLAGGLKFREGYGRKAWNNIIINNGFHPHVWFENSDSHFVGNVVMRAPGAIGMPRGWGEMVDKNFFGSKAALRSSRERGSDTHSIAMEVSFVDAVSGDFRLREDSPALKLGFKNFPMNQFGVKKPSLKAIARTPAIPALDFPSGEERPISSVRPYWAGALLHGLVGEEYSAFGTRKEDGGIQLVDVLPGSFAEKAGLQKNDLIQAVNGQAVENLNDFWRALWKAGNAPLKLKLVVHQKPVEKQLPAMPSIVAEAAPHASAFQSFLPTASSARASANPKTANDPIEILTDGKLTSGYGPVFPNGIQNGAYRLDLGQARPIKAFTSWTYNKGGNRAHQIVTIYGSRSTGDPGWDIDDRTRFTPIGSLDTRLVDVETPEYLAASLRAPEGTTFGEFRWVVWSVSPVTPRVENSAFQELSVEY